MGAPRRGADDPRARILGGGGTARPTRATESDSCRRPGLLGPSGTTEAFRDYWGLPGLLRNERVRGLGEPDRLDALALLAAAALARLLVVGVPLQLARD